MTGEKYIQIPKLLATLTYDGDYHYVDRLGYSHSKSLTLYYLKEALRDFHAIKRSPKQDMPDKVKQLINDINSQYLDTEIEQIQRISDTRELREVVSFICAKALAIALEFIKKPGE